MQVHKIIIPINLFIISIYLSAKQVCQMRFNE